MMKDEQSKAFRHDFWKAEADGNSFEHVRTNIVMTEKVYFALLGERTCRDFANIVQ